MTDLNPFMIHTKRLTIVGANRAFSSLYFEYKVRNKVFHKEWSPSYPDEYYTLSEIEKEMDEYSILFETEKGFKFLIFDKHNSKKVIGDFNFSNIVKGVFLSCHLGYSMDKYHLRKGIMQEALKGGFDFFFNKKLFHRIEANVMPRNIASIKLLEKLSFHKEGYANNYLKINGKWEDHIHYTLLNASIE